MIVSAIIVTRGDQNLLPIINSLPDEWQKLVWDNGAGQLHDFDNGSPRFSYFCEVPDLSVYGRYAAIEKRAIGELIYVQDDDCIVNDPTALVSKWVGSASLAGPAPADGSDLENVVGRYHVVCNMPPEFRHDFYEDHALVGFGAVFHRDAPQRAFKKFQIENYGLTFPLNSPTEVSWFHRTCDVVFTGLTPRVLADVPKENLPWADTPDRMWRQPEHQAERARMLDLVRQIA